MSDNQQHIIKRQLLELHFEGRRGAEELQDYCARLFKERVVSEIDRILSDLCGPDELIRIGRLEIDLAPMAVEELERGLPEQVRNRLREILIKKIYRARNGMEAKGVAIRRLSGIQAELAAQRSALECLVYYLQTGINPWWQAGPGFDFEALLIAAWQESPAALARETGALLSNGNSRRRLASRMRESDLMELLGMAVPAAVPAIRRIRAQVERLEWWKALQKAAGEKEAVVAVLDFAMLAALFHAYPLSREQDVEMAFLHYLQEQSPGYIPTAGQEKREGQGGKEARYMAIREKERVHSISGQKPAAGNKKEHALDEVSGLAAGNRQQTANKQDTETSENTSTSGQLDKSNGSSGNIKNKAAKQEGLNSTLPPPEGGKQPPEQHTVPKGQGGVESPETANTIEGEGRSSERSAVPQSREGVEGPETANNIQEEAGRMRKQSRDIYPVDGPGKTGEETQRESSARHLRNLDAAGREEQPTHYREPAPPSTEGQSKENISLMGAGVEGNPLFSLPEQWRTPPSRYRFELDKAVEEGLVIPNGGLVLLGPYLLLFFDGMGLLENKKFRDAAARQRAVQLLHYLYSGEEAGEEHDMALNKLLCGMRLSDFAAPEFRLTEPEKAGCDDLLEAVIRNWNAIKGTSVQGFRRSFLQKQGILGKEQHGWLLRIQRSSIDILLERLPWSVAVIRLPWNDYLIHVEW